MAKPQLLKRAAASVAALLVIAICALVVSQNGNHPLDDVSVEEISHSESMSLRRLERQNEHLADEVQSLKTDVEDEEKENDHLQGEVSALTSKVSGLIPLRGPPGPKGQTGDTGAPGAAGSIGPIGRPGPIGMPGPAGPPGIPGATGQTGETGARGPKGSPGFRGEAGRRGLPGTPGQPGAEGERGPPGKPGTPGEDGENGVQGPPGQNGVPGKDGKDGLPGKDGANGKNGVDGIDGQPGRPGKVGETGDPGPPGVPGPRGPRGDTGHPGARGRRGVPGAEGLQGPVGPVGAPGAPGPSAAASAAQAHKHKSLKGASSGLFVRWYTMHHLQKLPTESQFLSQKPLRVTTVPNIDYGSNGEVTVFANSGLKTDFAARFEGFLDIPRAGKWTFVLESDDGSKLFINKHEVVNNDGLHGMVKVSGSVVLTSGQHDIVVDFFQGDVGAGLILYWSGPGVPKPVAIPASAFRCNRVAKN